MANFPTSLPSATPADHGEVVGEVVAIATELGLDPSGPDFASAAARLDALPRGTLGYAQAVANQGSITVVVDLTSLTATVTVGTGRRVRITGFVPGVSSTTADAYVQLTIVEGASQLQACTVATPTIGNGVSAVVSVVVTPGAGSHTYKLRMGSVTAGTVAMSASATSPAYIHVEDVGV